MPSPDWIKQANEVPLIRVAAALGLSVRHGDLAACPICGITKRGSGRVFHREGSGFFCFYCNEGADVVDLVSIVLCGERLEKSPERNRQVQEWFSTTFATLPHEPHEERPTWSYPPADEVVTFAARLAHVSTSKDLHVLAWLRERRYNATMIPAAVLRQAPVRPSWWPWSFQENWPVVLPAFDFCGALRTFHGLATRRDRAPRKTTWPAGYSSGGTLFLDPDIARPIVSGKRQEPSRILLTEGATDYLTACQASKRAKEPYGVVGIESGFESALSAVGWPKGCTFFMDMDPDEAGARYEAKIRSALAPFPLRRLRPKAS